MDAKPACTSRGIYFAVHCICVQQRFLVGGVVSSLSRLDAMTRVRYSDLLGGYRQSGMLAGADAERIQQYFPAVRYLLLARIEQDRVSRQHNESETDVADSVDDANKGEYKPSAVAPG